MNGITEKIRCKEAAWRERGVVDRAIPPRLGALDPERQAAYQKL